jgi:alpha-ketoglutarate-dependent 2,4-dichlorophenoxyacetate dioxygenase
MSMSQALNTPVAASRPTPAAGAHRFTPLHPVIGARADGFDLRRPLSPAEVDAVRGAMDRYAVLVFPGQEFDDEGQCAFGRQFGEMEDVPTLVDQARRRLANARVNDISNLGADGQILAADDRRRMFNLGNLLWHSDSSFKPVPAHYSMLHARVIPPEGGETEFADMRAAWDALPPKLQETVRDLVCEHSLIFSRAQLGFDAFTPEEQARCAPVPQRLVRRHPGSGRLSLYLSAHIGGIRGWPRPEAMALIRELTERATQREFVYSHRWTVGDLVVWDNRCTMHRARPYEDQTYPRDMRRVTLTDVAPTLEQQMAA